MSTDSVLKEPPTDGISALNFSPSDPNLLACSSWDGSVRVYDTVAGSMICQYEHAEPALDCLLSPDGQCFSSGCDGQVMKYDIKTSQLENMKPFTHTEPVKCLAMDRDRQVLYSAGWDRQLQAVDLRQPVNLLSNTELPAKSYSMSMEGTILAVAMSDRLIDLYDVRSGLKQPYQRRVSSLKFQTRCIRLFPQQTVTKAYAISSIEGRVAVEYVDPAPEEQAKKFAFKCHRQHSTISLSTHGESEAVDIVYPVHAIAMHPKYQTFATGGGDGVVNTWDPVKRKRIRQYPKYETSISALSFNSSGQQLAIAVSYQFEQGFKDHPVDNIHIKTVVDTDIKPKQ